MAIDDPTALPENDQQVAEYLREADLAFEREQHDLALTLYWSLSAASLFKELNTAQRVYARVGSILVAQGNDDEAYRWFEAAGPAGADMLRVLDAKTTDAPVDPDVIPATPEVLTRYITAARSADQNQDHATFDALVTRIMESQAPTPGVRSEVALMMAKSLLARGEDAKAEEWARAALAESSGTTADEARKVIDKVQDNQLGNPNYRDERGITHGFELQMALTQFEGGLGDKGKASFEHVLNDTSGLNDDEAKGRAHYYLGMIAYHAHDFDVAREHLEIAADTAPAPEIGYAADALRWRFQEEG
jgi:tetratricopeptide (TPR) repeat protein